jgi:hypothetical protein
MGSSIGCVALAVFSSHRFPLLHVHVTGAPAAVATLWIPEGSRT